MHSIDISFIIIRYVSKAKKYIEQYNYIWRPKSEKRIDIK